MSERLSEYLNESVYMCVCLCVCVRVRARARVYVCVCVCYIFYRTAQMRNVTL